MGFWWSAGFPRCIAHAQIYGFGWWFSRQWFAGTPRKEDGWKHGQSVAYRTKLENHACGCPERIGSGGWSVRAYDFPISNANICTGAVAGPNGGVVKLQDALKKAWPDVASIPDLPDASASASASAGGSEV